MPNVYRAYNFAQPTTAAPALVTTGTAIKTMLQLATPATQELIVTEWGIMVDAGSTVLKCELIDTDVAATVTAHVASGLIKLSDPAARGSNLTLGVSATGYTATVEGTPGATSRLLGFTVLTNPGREWQQLPLSREPRVQVSRFLRFRVTASVAVDMGCYIDYEEC